MTIPFFFIDCERRKVRGLEGYPDVLLTLVPKNSSTDPTFENQRGLEDEHQFTIANKKAGDRRKEGEVGKGKQENRGNE